MPGRDRFERSSGPSAWQKFQGGASQAPRHLTPASVKAAKPSADPSGVSRPRPEALSNDPTNPNRTGKVTDSADLAKVVYAGYNDGKYGPISIMPVKVQDGKENYNAYLVTISGMDMTKGQATDLDTAIKSGLGLNNDLRRRAEEVIMKNIPKGSKVILAGHSLGGMVAQKLAADRDVKRDYDIKNTVAFGSPLLGAFRREGDVNRMVDTKDPVPHLSLEAFLLPFDQMWANRETSPYLNPIKAHNESYTNDRVWRGYDALGEEGGQASLTFNPQARRFFSAPED